MATFDKSRLDTIPVQNSPESAKRRKRLSVSTRRQSRNHPVACAAFDACKDAY